MQNYIRNATRVFKRYCNRFLNSEKRFIEPDCKSSAWVQAYNEASRDLSDDGVKKLKKLTAFTKCDGFANDTLTVLEHFTRDMPQSQRKSQEK